MMPACDSVCHQFSGVDPLADRGQGDVHALGCFAGGQELVVGLGHRDLQKIRRCYWKTRLNQHTALGSKIRGICRVWLSLSLAERWRLYHAGSFFLPQTAAVFAVVFAEIKIFVKNILVGCCQ